MLDTPSAGAPRSFSFSIDVERDYRLDRRLTMRGIDDGLPIFLDFLKARDIPYDLFLSSEVVPLLPKGLLSESQERVAFGCHGMGHVRGTRSYLNLKSKTEQEQVLSAATKTIREAIRTGPIHFRAPNFSADEATLAIIASLGYRSDSSVLPGRYVRKWRIRTVLDQRGAPSDPYHPSPKDIRRPGSSPVLEVPVTSLPSDAGSPLGLGYLNDAGVAEVLRAVRATRSRNIVFLCHTWEMVPWSRADPVDSWVPSASAIDYGALGQLIDGIVGRSFVNMDRILASSAHSVPIGTGADPTRS